MLSIASDAPGRVQLVGGALSGTAEVQELQEALRSLSQAAGWPAVNPGEVTGIVNRQTVTAVAAVLPKLAGKISKWVATTLQAALAFAQMNSDAMAEATSAIEQYAQWITEGVRALTLAYSQGPSVPTTTPEPTPEAVPTFLNRISKYRVAGSGLVAKSPEPAPLKKTVPSSAITAFSSKAGLWRVAVPESQAAGLGSSDLGQSFVELPSRADRPSGATVVSEKEFDDKIKKPFYKRPLFWVAAGGVVLLSGAGAWYFTRRR